MNALLNKFGLHFIYKQNKKTQHKSTEDIKTMLQQNLYTSDSTHTPQSSSTKVPASELTFNVSQYRSAESFNSETRRILNMITSGEDILPVGSLKYSIHRYPGDIDMYEEIKTCCSLNEASKNIKKKIQKIAKNIINETLVYMGDFKAGTDDRYCFTGIGKYDVYGTLQHYNPIHIRKKCIELKEQHLFSNKEYTTCLELIKTKPTKQEWDILHEYINTFYILRWDLDELVVGYKEISNKNKKYPIEIKIKLEDAIQSKSICKIDLWAPINGKYLEITNFLVFIYVDHKGNENIINTNVEEYIISLIKDLKKYGSGYKKNSLKYAKRVWAIANTLDETKKLKLLVPLFSSGAAILYQISAEIELLIQMLQEIEDKPLSTKGLLKANIKRGHNKKRTKTIKENLHPSPVPTMIEQIENFKQRIALVYENFTESERVFSYIHTITSFYYSNKKKYLNSKEKQIIIDNLIDIQKIVDTYVEKYASTYLANNNLNDIYQYDSVL